MGHFDGHRHSPSCCGNHVSSAYPCVTPSRSWLPTSITPWRTDNSMLIICLTLLSIIPSLRMIGGTVTNRFSSTSSGNHPTQYASDDSPYFVAYGKSSFHVLNLY